jgi:hypothetical protein
VQLNILDVKCVCLAMFSEATRKARNRVDELVGDLEEELNRSQTPFKIRAWK